MRKPVGEPRTPVRGSGSRPSDSPLNQKEPEQERVGPTGLPPEGVERREHVRPSSCYAHFVHRPVATAIGRDLSAANTLSPMPAQCSDFLWTMALGFHPKVQIVPPPAKSPPPVAAPREDAYTEPERPRRPLGASETR